jgi:hypothetical protein
MKSVLLLFTLLIANSAAAATALPDAEKHRLASYLAYITVGVDTSGPGGGSIYTVGANCPECNGVGKVGDGVTMLTCEWDDGKFYCNGGKIAQKAEGDAMDYEVDEAMCEATCNCGNCDGACGGGCCDNCNCATPERDELFDKLDNPPARFNESFVRQLENDLQNALEEVQTLKAGKTCQPCAAEEQTEDQPEKIAIEEPSSDVLTLFKMPGPSWNWSGRSTASTSTNSMKSHLAKEHGIDTSGMTRSQLIIAHNNDHNGYPAMGRATYESSSPCPDGQCPLPGSSGSSGSSCPTCPGGSGSSRSYSRGFGFFRR